VQFAYWCAPVKISNSAEYVTELLCDWWFTANQFVLAPSPLRITIRFFSTEHLRSQSLCNIFSDEKMGLSLMNMLGLLPRVRIAHIACYCKVFLVHYAEALSLQALQGRSYLSYVSYTTTAAYSVERLSAWPLPSLSLLYFLCLVSPCPIPRTCSFSWFRMTSVCCMHNFLYCIIVYLWKVQSCVKIGDRFAQWKISNGAENLVLQSLQF
jgi:hypothetical protein